MAPFDSARGFQAEVGRGSVAGMINMSVNGVRVTFMPTASGRAGLARPAQVAAFWALEEARMSQMSLPELGKQTRNPLSSTSAHFVVPSNQESLEK